MRVSKGGQNCNFSDELSIYLATHTSVGLIQPGNQTKSGHFRAQCDLNILGGIDGSKNRNCVILTHHLSRKIAAL